MQKLDFGGSPDVERRFRWQQYLAALLATLSALCCGAVLGWTAPVLPYLQHNAPEPGVGNFSCALPEPLTDEEASWVGALTSLGGLAGALPAGWAAARLGRQRCLLALGMLLAASWTMVATAQFSVWLLLAARVAGGIASGAVTVVLPLYCEEIAEPAIRGALGSYLDLMLALGILWAYALGAVLPYVWLAVASAAPPLLFCALFALMPESPVHLLAKGDWTGAEKALVWLRGAKNDPSRVQGELQAMQKTALRGEAKSAPAPDTPLRPGEAVGSATVSVGRWDASRATRRACVAVFGLMVFQQLSGIDAILYYCVDVFTASGVDMSPLAATVVSGVVQAVATVGASLLVDRVGRRPLLQLSAAAMAAAHAALAVNFAPLFSVNLYLVAFAVGLGPLPWFMMAELLPPETKSWASGAAVSLNWSLSFVVTKWFGSVMTSFGSTATYTAFCVICALLGAFVTLFVPETKGKTRDEIQENLTAA